MNKEQSYLRILNDVAKRLRLIVNNYDKNNDAEQMKQGVLEILEGKGKAVKG